MPVERMFLRQVRLVSRDDESDGIDRRRSCKRSWRWLPWFGGTRPKQLCGNVEWTGEVEGADPLVG